MSRFCERGEKAAKPLASGTFAPARDRLLVRLLNPLYNTSPGVLP